MGTSLARAERIAQAASITTERKKKSTKIVFLLAQRRKPSEFKDFIGVYHKRRSTGHWPDLLSA